MVYDIEIKASSGGWYTGMDKTIEGVTPKDALNNLIKLWESRGPDHGNGISRVKLTPQIKTTVFERDIHDKREILKGGFKEER